MAAFKLMSSCLLLAWFSSGNEAAKTCQSIKDAKPLAPSGIYTVTTQSGEQIQIYCEMGLGDGGYTFLTPQSVMYLTDAELSTMFTNRTTFLLRVRKTDGTQPFAILRQLYEYESIPLKLGLSNHDGYNPPINKLYDGLQPPFLYFGFLPIADAANNNVQGLMVNSYRNAFRNCDENPNSQFALYTDFEEFEPASYYVPAVFCDRLFENLLPNPSGRIMPPEIFFFGETTWGGCGCYVSTNRMETITGFNIGFK